MGFQIVGRRMKQRFVTSRPCGSIRTTLSRTIIWGTCFWSRENMRRPLRISNQRFASLRLDGAGHDLMERANRALGRLDGVALLLLDLSLFLYFYVRQEAVLSSQIEGVQSSLSDLLLFKTEAAPGVPIYDLREESNYVAALNHGLCRIREGALLTSRLIRELHGVLMQNGRNARRNSHRTAKTRRTSRTENHE